MTTQIKARAIDDGAVTAADLATGAGFVGWPLLVRELDHGATLSASG